MPINDSNSGFETPNADVPPSAPRRGVLGWIIRHPKLTGMGVFTLLFIGTCEFVDMRAKHAFQYELDTIRASGEPVTLDDLNAVRCDVPDDENIAILIEAPARTMSGCRHWGCLREYTSKTRNALLIPCGERMSAEVEAAVAAYVADLQPHMRQLLEALQHEGGWNQPAYTVASALGNASMSWLTETRNAAKDVAIECRLAMQHGDTAAAYQALCDLAAFKYVFRGRDDCLASLVRLGVNRIFQSAVEDAINLGELDDAQLAQIAERVSQPDWLAQGRRVLVTQRVLNLTTNEWLFTSSTPIGSNEPLPRRIRLIPGLRYLCNAKGLHAWQAFIDAFDKPESEILEAVEAARQSLDTLPRYCMLWQMLMPSDARSITLHVEAVGSQRAMIAALACERYRLASGEWPESLDALVPEHLDVVPLDPFDAKPIRYKQFEHGIIVYSVGEDQQDGGGDVTHRDINHPKEKPTDEGYVLLNPELRNREPAAGDDAKDESTDEES